MLREIKGVKQIPGEPRRRWFHDRFFDLVVWCSENDHPVGFQLCYKEGFETKALTWWEDSGFKHNRIDEGEDRTGRPKMAPILIADGRFDKDGVLPKFQKAGREIDAKISRFVTEKIRQYF